jgi:hypothetical protein
VPRNRDYSWHICKLKYKIKGCNDAINLVKARAGQCKKYDKSNKVDRCLNKIKREIGEWQAKINKYQVRIDKMAATDKRVAAKKKNRGL